MSDPILTIAAPASSSDLTTPDAVATDADIDTGGDNSQLYADIAAVSRTIVGYIGRDLGLATYRETFRPDRHDEGLNLARYPIAEVTSVSEASTVLAVSAYEVDAEAGQIFRLSGSDTRSRWACSKVVVVYKAGYLLPRDDGYEVGAAGSLPPDIEKAAVIACRALYQSRGRDPMVKGTTIPGVIEEQLWVGTDPAQGESGLPIESERLLDRYRNIVFG